MYELYGAYGSNLNLKQMKKRCPYSKPFHMYKLKKWRLVFKGVADIEKYEDGYTLLGIYRITKKCEKALDSYEDFPILYKKVFLNVIIASTLHKIMIYKMASRFKYSPPTEEYYSVIKEGYEDWNFNNDNLIMAGKESLKFKNNKGYRSKNWSYSKIIDKKSFR